MVASEVASALRLLIDRVERLPAHDRRNPHAFTEAKSDIAAELSALADALTARDLEPAAPRSSPSRPRHSLKVLVRKVSCS